MLRCPALLSLACLGAATLAGPARAEAPDELRLEVHAVRALLDLADRPFVATAPYRAAGLRFLGAGTATGAGFGLLGVVEGYHVGLGLSGYTVSGTSLGHGPLGSYLQASLATPWGLTVPFVLGRELDWGRARPYLELRVGASLVHWEIDARSAQVGALTPLQGTQTYLYLAPRLGVAFRLTDVLLLDTGVSASPLGVERAALLLGLAYSPRFPPR